MLKRILLPLFFAMMLGMSSAQTRKADLQLYYTMDELPAVDRSPKARGNATTVGSLSLVPGRFGQALNIPNVNGDSGLNAGIWTIPGPAASVTAWVTINNAADAYYMKVMSCKKTFEDPLGFEVQYNPSMKQFVLIGSGTSPLVTSSQNVSLIPNKWYHVAMVANNNVGAIYLDGVDITVTTALAPIKANPNKEILIGTSDISITNAGGAWRGQLDDVRIYGVALTKSDIQAIIAEAGAMPSNTFTGSSAVPSSSASTSASATSTDTNTVVVPTDTNSSNTDVSSATDSTSEESSTTSESVPSTSAQTTSEPVDTTSTNQPIPSEEEGAASHVAASFVAIFAAFALLF